MVEYSRTENGSITLPDEIRRLAERANVPKRFLGAHLHRSTATGDTAEATREFVTTFPDHGGIGMLFVGPTGLGKTHFAAAAINEALRTWSSSMDMSAFFFNVQTDLAELLDNRYFRRYDSYDSVMRKLYTVELLVIDDLLHVPQHEYSKDMLYRIYEARYEAELPTITTLNATILIGDDGAPDWSPISNTFNEPFVRRLVQTAGDNIVLI